MCKHKADTWPRYEIDAGQSKWRRFFTGVTYATLYWVCAKCGTEMEPVFREKTT